MMKNIDIGEYYEELARAEVRKLVEPKLKNITSDLILLDREQAMRMVSMKRSFFDKYIKNEPEVRLIERHPVNPADGMPSPKPFYDPDELKKAVHTVMQRWE